MQASNIFKVFFMSERDEEDPHHHKKNAVLFARIFFFFLYVAPKAQTLAFLLPPSFTSQTTNGKGKETTQRTWPLGCC